MSEKTFNLYFNTPKQSRNFIPDLTVEAVKWNVGIILRDGGEITGIIDVEKD